MSADPHVDWDGVNEGDVLTGFTTHLTWTTMSLQVSGTQDWNRVHHDPDFAHESGHQGVFYNTGWTMAMLSRVVTDWMGPHGWVNRLSFQMRQMNQHGDEVRAHGRVESKRRDGDSRFVEVQLTLENSRVGTTTTGSATVEFGRTW